MEANNIELNKKEQELQLGYIVDAVIDIKIEKFGERFVSVQEVLIIQKLMELRLKNKGLRVKFIDLLFLNNYFRIDNDVITKLDEIKTLQSYISNEEIRKIIYDKEFIYYCLCQILINKLNNSMEHNCKNCTTECTGLFGSYSKPNDCTKWTHDFIEDCINNISTSERSLIEENQIQQGPVKKLKKDDEYMRRLSQIIKKDFAEDE